MNKKFVFLLFFLYFFIQADSVNADQLPDGWHDPADGSACTVDGWACDVDKPGQPIEVEFYRLIPGGSPGFIGKKSAPNSRETAVGDRCGGDVNHGFSYRLPMFFNDSETYEIEARAVGIDANGNPDGTTVPLGGNPQSIRCAYAPFLGPQEAEPNNSFTNANGPIEFGRSYDGNFDTHDMYKMYLVKGQAVHISVAAVQPGLVQVSLYHQSGNSLVAIDQEPPFIIDFTPAVSGWFYLDISNYYDPNNHSPYTLSVDDIGTPSPTTAPPPIDGDYDTNHVVNVSDFLQLIYAFGQINSSVNLVQPQAIDIFDYTMFISNYGVDYR